jgi:hypothetical protein
LLVGYSNGLNAYIYFGSSSGLPLAPSVTIQGTASAFGQSVSVLGDINKDGKQDIGIGSPREGNGVVYVFLGRDSWPALLTAAGASCVITVDATAEAKYSASYVGFQLAGLGDFNGDGTDDFAVSAPFYNSLQGQLAIIYGNSLGMPATIELPTAFGSAATRIDGDATFQGSLGLAITGIGHFYGSSANTTIVASAPYGPSGAYNGRLYSFTGEAGTPASIGFGAARHTYTAGAGVLYGVLSLTPLGDVGNGGFPALGVSMRAQAKGEIRSGDATVGPFVNVAGITSTDGTGANTFGAMLIGGGFSGRSATVSAIGSSKADLITATTAGSGPRLFIADGSKIVFGADTAIQNIADVTLPLSGTWTDFSASVTMLRDINKDGYADIGLADTTYTATLIDGKVLVLY